MQYNLTEARGPADCGPSRADPVAIVDEALARVLGKNVSTFSPAGLAELLKVATSAYEESGRLRFRWTSERPTTDGGAPSTQAHIRLLRAVRSQLDVDGLLGVLDAETGCCGEPLREAADRVRRAFAALSGEFGRERGPRREITESGLTRAQESVIDLTKTVQAQDLPFQRSGELLGVALALSDRVAAAELNWLTYLTSLVGEPTAAVQRVRDAAGAAHYALQETQAILDDKRWPRQRLRLLHRTLAKEDVVCAEVLDLAEQSIDSDTVERLATHPATEASVLKELAKEASRLLGLWANAGGEPESDPRVEGALQALATALSKVEEAADGVLATISAVGVSGSTGCGASSSSAEGSGAKSSGSASGGSSGMSGGKS